MPQEIFLSQVTLKIFTGWRIGTLGSRFQFTLIVPDSNLVRLLLDFEKKNLVTRFRKEEPGKIPRYISTVVPRPVNRREQLRKQGQCKKEKQWIMYYGSEAGETKLNRGWIHTRYPKLLGLG